MKLFSLFLIFFSLHIQAKSEFLNPARTIIGDIIRHVHANHKDFAMISLRNTSIHQILTEEKCQTSLEKGVSQKNRYSMTLHKDHPMFSEIFSMILLAKARGSYIYFYLDKEKCSDLTGTSIIQGVTIE